MYNSFPFLQPYLSIIRCSVQTRVYAHVLEYIKLCCTITDADQRQIPSVLLYLELQITVLNNKIIFYYDTQNKKIEYIKILFNASHFAKYGRIVCR